MSGFGLRGFRRGRHRKTHPEGAAGAPGALNGDLCLVQPRDLLDDRQAQADALALAGLGGVLGGDISKGRQKSYIEE